MGTALALILLIPLWAVQLGSCWAKANSISKSTGLLIVCPLYTSFKLIIALCIWASEILVPTPTDSPKCNTWTTTGMVYILFDDLVLGVAK